MKWYIGDMVTGRDLIEIPVTSQSTWSRQLNGADGISATVPTFDPEVQALELFGTVSCGKSFIAATFAGYVLAAGPVWKVSWNMNERLMQIDGNGLASYFEHRILMPLSGATDPVHASSTWTNLSLGTIAVRIIQQSETWTGGNLPLVYPADVVETGTTRTYAGSDLTPIWQRLQELVQVDNGPDIDFYPRFQSDGHGIEWLVRVGTPTDPLLHQPSTFFFNASVPGSSVRDIQLEISGSQLAMRGWAMTTDDQGNTLIAQSNRDTMIQQGWPLLELVDSFHTDIKDVTTLKGYADTLVRNGAFAIQTLHFKAKADEDPRLGEYTVGDWISLRIRNDEFLPDGDYRHRIVSLDGDAEARWVNIACQPGMG